MDQGTILDEQGKYVGIYRHPIYSVVDKIIQRRSHAPNNFFIHSQEKRGVEEGPAFLRAEGLVSRLKDLGEVDVINIVRDVVRNQYNKFYNRNISIFTRLFLRNCLVSAFWGVLAQILLIYISCVSANISYRKLTLVFYLLQLKSFQAFCDVLSQVSANFYTYSYVCIEIEAKKLMLASSFFQVYYTCNCQYSVHPLLSEEILHDDHKSTYF